MDIEILAATAVEASISKTNVLKAFISKNDKEPSWDGYIYIYANKEKRKNGLKRVPVQVKGVINNNLTLEKINYAIEVKDLKNYLEDGGSLYFVVYISDDGEKTSIYYVDLLPVKLRQILDNKNNKETISVPLDRFPSDNNEKVSVVLAFHSNREKQMSFIHADLYCENEIIDASKIESRFINAIGYDVKKEKPFNFLFNGDLYSYIKIKDVPVPIPVKETVRMEAVNKRTKASIKIRQKEYYDFIETIYTKDFNKITFGNCLYLVIYKDGKTETGIKIPPILSTSVNDFSFALDLFRYKEIEINGEICRANDDADVSKEKIEEFENNLEYCKNAEKVFDKFSLNKNYDLSKMTDQDKQINAMLIQCVVSGSPIKLDHIKRPLVRKVDFANSKIIIFFKLTETENFYLIQDYFLSDVNIYVENINGEKELTSKYDIVSVDDFVEVANIRFEDITNSYKQLSSSSRFDCAVGTLLRLLLAYDRSNSKRNDIYDAAKELSEWLYEESATSSISTDIAYLNKLQVIKRKRKLNKEEKATLRTIASDKSQPIINKIGANLLLDKTKESEKLLDMLTDEEKENFKKFPIFKFYKNQAKSA